MRLRARLPVLALLAFAVSAPAQSRENQAREIAAAKKRVNVLMSEAEELMQAGRVNQAERLLRQAKELKSRLRRAESRVGGGREKERTGRGREFHGLFHHLEGAVHALRELDRGEQAERLSALAKELRQSLTRHSGERDERSDGHRRGRDREQLQWELNMFRLAKAMFREVKKNNLVELVEQSMHARELKIVGRRDRGAQEIMHAQPSVGNEVELLAYASQLYKKHGAGEKAAGLAKLAKQLSSGKKTHKKNEKEKKRKKLTERQAALQQLEYMRYSAGVLKKAKRLDAAESLRHAANALKLKLDGRRDEEAQTVIKRAPDRAAIARHFFMTAEILQDQNDRGHAEAVAKMGKQFAAQAERVARSARDRRRNRKKHRDEAEIEEKIGEEIEEVHEERSERREDKQIRELRRHVEELERVLKELQEANKRKQRRRDSSIRLPAK
jgi:hypothetical protein